MKSARWVTNVHTIWLMQFDSVDQRRHRRPRTLQPPTETHPTTEAVWNVREKMKTALLAGSLNSVGQPDLGCTGYFSLFSYNNVTVFLRTFKALKIFFITFPAILLLSTSTQSFTGSFFIFLRQQDWSELPNTFDSFHSTTSHLLDIYLLHNFSPCLIKKRSLLSWHHGKIWIRHDYLTQHTDLFFLSFG